MPLALRGIFQLIAAICPQCLFGIPCRLKHGDQSAQ